ncbi:MAG: hypothetical protein FI718_02590 [SAR202 cluster bacterium]|nr:hypothetical protein [SAR202 cluster bacterium]|tara:strand:- start:2643 stop:3263 length:621 start_codon:yes stop_codon:yes gene_type:complete
MIGQIRTYTINKGMMQDWIKLYKSELYPRNIELGIDVPVVSINDEDTQFIWIRMFKDEEDLKSQEEILYGSDWWKNNVENVRSHIAHRNIQIIKAVTDMPSTNISGHSVAHLRTYTINKGMLSDWLNLFQTELYGRVKQTKMGMPVLSVNDEDTKFIWVRTYKDEDDLKTKEEAFYGSDYWVTNVNQIRGHLADRNIQNICLIDPK